MEEKKLFLLDAYALIYRAYYAMMHSRRITSKGLNTSAVFGFVNTLEDVLKKENPTHIAVCFDPPGGHTFRHELYPEYKAQRDKQPEDITVAVPYIKEILAAYRIPVVEMEGYEADDVIGTLSRKAEEAGFTTYMMTPDKDYGQLVTDRVFMYRPALKGKDFEIRGPQQVCERYGIESPRQVIDMLALEGDVSDNVPGCPGIGEKTAAKLIREFGSVEGLLSNVDQLKGAQKAKVEANGDQILFSKLLVTIKTDVPLEVDVDEKFRRRPIDDERLRKVYTELEFKSFLAKLNAEAKSDDKTEAAGAAPASLQGSLFDFDNASEMPLQQADSSDFTISYTPEAVSDIVAAIGEGHAGMSLYSVGEEAMTAQLLGIAIAYAGADPVYIPLTGGESKRRGLLDALKALFAGKATLVSHDVKRDIIISGSLYTSPRPR
ncbi:MAG: DNA polymerase I, partial [Muribaculaceae bacterium]|nr:DNA polymerase I [Muribaculaceae bacterium]